MDKALQAKLTFAWGEAINNRYVAEMSTLQGNGLAGHKNGGMITLPDGSLVKGSQFIEEHDDDDHTVVAWQYTANGVTYNIIND